MPADISPVLEPSKMSKTQKLAALLIVLGPESAAHILGQFDPPEIEALAAEMAKMPVIPQDLQREILREFSDVAVQASTALSGGLSYVEQLLEKSVGSFRAAEMLHRISPRRPQASALDPILDMEARQIFNLLKEEQPQTIALVLSYMPPEKSSQALMFFSPEFQDQVVERLATLAPIPVEVVENIGRVLAQKFGAKLIKGLSQTGGVKTAADILNAMDKSASKSLLISLEERNPGLGQSIRHKMFTFEDLAGLDRQALQKILRETETRDLAVALKGGSDKLKSILLGCISKRAAETVLEEMSFTGPLKLREIEAAQSRVIESVRRLESEGEIELAPSQPNRDEVLV